MGEADSPISPCLREAPLAYREASKTFLGAPHQSHVSLNSSDQGGNATGAKVELAS